MLAGEPQKDMPGQQAGRVPVMRMYGINDAGNSICCHVHGFSPYFYVTAPPTLKEANLTEFKVLYFTVIVLLSVKGSPTSTCHTLA